MKLLLLTACATAFVVPAPRFAGVRPQTTPPRETTQLRAADDPEALLAQAAALRDEAKALEQAMRSEQEAKMQKAMEQAFAKADVNGDGVVTVDELKATLRTGLRHG